jgi:outer membrane protein TolC
MIGKQPFEISNRSQFCIWWSRFAFHSQLLALLSCAIPEKAESAEKPLRLNDVLQSVSEQYPPYLAALIERDIASGRHQSALGAMDLQTYLRLFNNPTGFYESTTAEIGLEQFTNFRGATIFGGYQHTEGFLPDYYRSRRTDAGGTPRLGIRLPLLRNGAIDSRRAAIFKTDLDRKLADPFIRKQHLNFILSAMKTYHHWLATGQKLEVTESLLGIAQEREKAIQTQIEKGLVAPIAALENKQLVVSRRLATAKARRQLEAATVTLSLLHRNTNDEPILAKRNRLPAEFPAPLPLPTRTLSLALQHASNHRPEIQLFELELEKLNINTKLLRNQRQPQLDAYIAASQSLGESRYKDTGEFELELGIEFKMPLQQNRAKGNIKANAAKVEQLTLKTQFAFDRIAAEVWDAHSAVKAAWEQHEQAELNVLLANQLHEVEQDRFSLGAVDFLPLQLREQSAYQASLLQIDILKQYYDALATLIIVTGIDCRTALPDGKGHLMQAIQHLNSAQFDTQP